LQAVQTTNCHHYKWSSSSQLECSDNPKMAYYVATTTTRGRDRKLISIINTAVGTATTMVRICE